MNTLNTCIKMVFDRWNAAIANWDNILNELSDETLLKQIAPNKNRGIYLLGHMIAVHDDMLKLLDLGDKQYPELYDPYIKSADNPNTQYPSVSELRGYWSRQCEALKQKFESLNPEDWFEKHTAISEEDFAKEPHRNKLNIILNRTTHLAYHTGQLQVLK